MPNAQPNQCTSQLSVDAKYKKTSAQDQQNNNNTYETNCILQVVVNALGEHNDSAASGDASTEITLAMLLRPVFSTMYVLDIIILYVFKCSCNGEDANGYFVFALITIRPLISTVQDSIPAMRIRGLACVA